MLAEQGLPLDTQMRDNLERKDFLQWAKDDYHASPLQQELQRKDRLEPLRKGEKCSRKLLGRTHSRWSRELQRRLGSSALWLMVSFTGRVDLALLQQLSAVGSSQTDEATREPTQSLTRVAQRARERLRYAESLRRQELSGRKKFKPMDKEELELLATGTLLREANEATQRSGFGRLRLADGGYEDITQHGAGILRTVLDGMLPNIEAAGTENLSTLD